MNLRNEIQKYIDAGYSDIFAMAKVSQDIILLKISQYNMSDKITIKGGVVMMQLSKDKRRATRDLDIDFIKYSLDNESIENFINKMSDSKIRLSIKNIIKLHHLDYDGKRVFLEIVDKYNNKIETKIDLGVHNDLDIEQEKMFFDLHIIDNKVSLLANSREQIFVEKLISLLKFRIASTRYKDVFDLYFLLNDNEFDKQKCELYINKLIFSSDTISINDFSHLYKVLNSIFNNKQFQSKLNNANNNWLGLPTNIVTDYILKFFFSLENIEV